MNVPQNNKLPVEYLAGVFSHTASSYKFYWLLAILHKIAHNPNQSVFSINELLLQMIAEVWYTVNDYRLSFGKNDKLGEVVLQLNDILKLPANTHKNEIVKQVDAFLQQNPKHAISKSIKERGLLVPFRFLTPWFSSQLRGLADAKKNQVIANLAQTNFATCLYQFTNNQTCIELQPDWLAYLQQHLAIIEGFCYWHLTKYLQKNNPNVPNIPDKLQSPQRRDLRNANKFWQIFLSQTGGINCIYSGQLIVVNDFSIDHFLPWSFVAHDLLWNLLPVPKAINSAKNNAIPSLNTYFDSFAALQYKAVKVVAPLKHTLLEDYGTVFKDDLATILQMPYDRFRLGLYENVSPMAQIAGNMGFTKNWIYSL